MIAPVLTSVYLQWPDYMVRMLTAVFLGGLIGLERDIHGRAAGLRTHLLVSLGASVFTLMSISFSSFPEQPGDISRIAAQIVTGIGFLGAGAILKEGLSIRGLTTAASLWVTAAVGMSAGGGRLDVALATTLMAIFALVSLQHLERIIKRDTYRYITIVLSDKAFVLQVLETVRACNVKIIYYDLEHNFKEHTTTVRLQVRLFTGETVDDLSLTISDALQNRGMPLERLSWNQ